jgi:hypothetical protein
MKTHKGGNEISIVITKDGEKIKIIETCQKQVEFIYDGVMGLEKKMEAMCFHLLHY